MKIDASRAPSAASPLWIIALFIALSQATAGIASITTDGAARLIFATFAVAFPAVVFATFTLLLIYHTPKLYPPNQYTESITPEVFARGVGRRGISTADSAAIGKAVASVVLEGTTDSLAPHDVDLMRDALLDRFEQTIRESAVSVDLSRIVEGAGVVLFPVDEGTSVGDLLDDIYIAMGLRVEPFSYQKSWILERPDGTRLYEIGSTWANGQGSHRDERTLHAVGIMPGDQFRVVRCT